MNTIRKWLESMDLERYAEAFEANAIEPAHLSELDHDILKEIGVTAVGHRLTLLKAAASIDFESSSQITSEVTAVPRAEISGDAERRQLTVMFCDMVGSTALSDGMDPEEYREIVTAFQTVATQAVKQFEGYVARYMGDGMLVYFGYPAAHEDDAELAARAGLALVSIMSARPLVGQVEVAVRVGISTGMVVVGDLVGEGTSEERAVLGDTPNLAARLQSAAAPNTVVISQTTRRLVAGHFHLEALDALQLKGFSGPVPAWRLLGERLTDSRFEARHSGHLPGMVGREQELGLLVDRWRQAQAGEGQMVLLTGEAGIGKSRITRALIDLIDNDAHTRISYQCSPYQSDSALHPIIEQLVRACGFTAADSLAQRLDKLEKLIALGTSDVRAAAPLFAALLGVDGVERYGALNMTPQQQRRRTLEALSEQPRGLSLGAPVLMVMEDIHWIDPTSLELMDLILDKLSDARVLLLATARPTFEHSFGAHPIVTQLTLNRLGRSQIMRMVERLSEGKSFPAELCDEIVKRTDGVPLFVEELTKTVLEAEQLNAGADGQAVSRAFSGVTIPTSLHDSLMARLDRLQPVKEVAQTAACIGRVFDYRMMSAISPLSNPELENALERLGEAELVFCRGAPPEATYTFKHALVRDAAYESLLRSTRQQIHARIFAALEDAGDQPPEIIAHHARQAGFIDQAVRYWQQAGAGALSRSANQEAVGHLRNAISLARTLGDDPVWKEKELELQVLLGQALIANRGYGARETMEAFEQAIQIADATGNTRYRIPALFGQWSGEYIRSGPTRGLVEGFESITDSGTDSGPKVIALRMRALEELHSGHFSQALKTVNKALATYTPTEHRDLALEYGHDPRVATLNYKSWLTWWLGCPDQSSAASKASLTWAEEIGHANTLGISYCWGVVLPHALQLRLHETVEQASFTLEFAEERVMPLWQGWSRVFLGWAQVQLGDTGGLEKIRAGLDELDEIGAARFLPWTRALYAEAQSSVNEYEGAWQTMQSAFKALSTTRDYAWESELYRIRGDIRARCPEISTDDPFGYGDFKKAIAIARKQSAKSLELRAALSLARLQTAQGAHAQARGLLLPLFDGFTEGFDTPDLVSAKTLLDAV